MREQFRLKIIQDIQYYILYCCLIYDYQVYVVLGFEVLQNIDIMLNSLESIYYIIVDGYSDLKKYLIDVSF